MVAKTNKYTVLIIILSVLLAISLIVGSTFAWFTSQDQASRTIVLGGPVELNIVDRGNNVIEGDGYQLPITIMGNKLLPGMQVNVLARVLFGQSTTPALLRAKINVKIEEASEENEELISDLENQLNLTLHGAVDTDRWVHNPGDSWWYFVGSNTIYYDDLTQTELIRIDNSEEDKDSRLVTFLSDSFIFPYYVGNNFANSDVIFSVEFQAVQGYLPAFDETELIFENETDAGLTAYRKNKIVHVIEVFEEAFPIN